MSTPSHVRNLRALRTAASRAKSASELRAIILEAVPRHGLRVPIEILGERYSLLSGRKLGESLLDHLISRVAKAQLVDRPTATRRVGNAMMSLVERVTFTKLTGSPKLDLFRQTDYTKFTGWCLTEDVARAQWSRHLKPALALDRLTVRPESLLAVKRVGRHLEAVLVRSLNYHPRRELLT